MIQSVIPHVTVKRVLIADDERLVQDYLSEFFVKLNYQVDTAENAQELNAKVQDIEYAVVLLSCGFSSGTGLTLLSELSTSYPDTSVVMMSADPHLNTVIAALRKGAVDFVIKPLDFGELAEIVHKAYDWYELQKMYRVMSRQMRRINDSPVQRGSVLMESMAD